MGPRLSWIYWIPTGFVLTQYIISIKVITGRSMQSTLNPNSSLSRDVALCDRFSVHSFSPFARGDIITFRSPDDQKRLLIKRIVGVEGDVVKTLPPCSEPIVQVPKGHVWVEGDESHHSDDSNRFGPVPLGLAESRLLLLIWPPHRFGPLPKSSPRLFERVAVANVRIRGAKENRIRNL